MILLGQLCVICRQAILLTMWYVNCFEWRQSITITFIPGGRGTDHQITQSYTVLHEPNQPLHWPLAACSYPSLPALFIRTGFMFMESKFELVRLFFFFSSSSFIGEVQTCLLYLGVDLFLCIELFCGRVGRRYRIVCHVCALCQTSSFNGKRFLTSEYHRKYYHPPLPPLHSNLSFMQQYGTSRRTDGRGGDSATRRVSVHCSVLECILRLYLHDSKINLM